MVAVGPHVKRSKACWPDTGILLRFDSRPDMDRQLRAIDGEIARHMEQRSEIDRHFLG
jgi:hypothetical protein